VTATVDDLLVRERIRRVGPHELAAVLGRGGLVIDIRPESLRAQQGELPGALVVERNVLEWRLDPASPDRLPQVTGHDREVVVVCSEGYASSMAAATLVDLGYQRAGDLVGGYLAWRSWFAAGQHKISAAEA
jgi:rhodanese-related sulfurtransferase